MTSSTSLNSSKLSSTNANLGKFAMPTSNFGIPASTGTTTMLPPKYTPSLRMKTNELFYRWFSEPERHDQIKEIIHFIKSTGRIPKTSELKTFKNTVEVQQRNASISSSTPSNLANTASSYGQDSTQQIQNQQQSNKSNSNMNRLRPKSPPSMQSPPMSPIGRMPNSPKSPKQRQNMMMIINNNGTASNSSLANDSYPNRVATNSQQKMLSNKETTQFPNVELQAASESNREKAVSISNDSSSSLLNSNESATRDARLSGANRMASDTSNKEKLETSNGTPVLASKPDSTSEKVTTTGSTVKSMSSALSNLANNTSAISTNSSPKLGTGTRSGQQAKSTTAPLATSKHLASGKACPPFYFPHGKSTEKQFKGCDDVECMKLVNAEFRTHKDGRLNKEDFGDLLKIIGLPRYWKILLFRMCTQGTKLNYVTYSTFEQVWTKLTSNCHERVALFMKLISSSSSTSSSTSLTSSHHHNHNHHPSIVYEDWEPLMQDIVDTHPGLKFLHDHKEFHTRYIKTVIARIYYTVNRSWSGRITTTELRRSNFLSVLESLENEEDINLIKDYFSYEHFYVIYCKFWELDKDHDLFISKEDLYRHNNYAISPKVIDRIFNGTVIRSKDWRDGLMSYYDFVWFLISEEDKRNPTSIEYWFRILDLDGDGVLSMYELEYFYNEQIEQMRERQIEYMPFTDLLCQILDLVKPTEPDKIRLKDLKACKMSNVFFDTFINLEKYLEYEQRDPFSNMRDLDGPDFSDWEKYAADEYENLVSEDVNGEPQDCYNNYEDDFEDEPLLFNNLNLNQKNSNYQMQPNMNENSINSKINMGNGIGMGNLMDSQFSGINEMKNGSIDGIGGNNVGLGPTNLSLSGDFST